MMLKNFFKPRWQHSNPQIRRQALAELTDDHEVLIQIACQDTDLELRKLAIDRITNLIILDRLARTDLDEQIREFANERFKKIFSGEIKGPSLTERLMWIERGIHADLLIYLARYGVESGLRSAVLARINDDEVLAASAVADPDTKVRNLAASYLSDRTILERVAKLLRNRDKGVYRIIQERLEEIKEQEDRPRRQRLIRAQLCADAEALVRRGHWVNAGMPLARLEERWAKSEGVADADLLQRFNKAITIIHQGINAEDQRTNDRTHIAESLATLRAEKNSLCLTLDNLAKDLDSRDQLAPEELAMARSLMRTIENGWAQSNILPASEEVRLNKQFQDTQDRINARFNELSHRAELLNKARTLYERAAAALSSHQIIEEVTLKDWQREWQELGINKNSSDNSSEMELVRKFQEVFTTIQQRSLEELQQREQAYNQVAAIVTALEEALEQGSLKNAMIKLTDAQNAVNVLATDARSNLLKARIEKGATTVRQLQEWQRWSNDRERERLCAAAEALINNKEHPEQLATSIRELRDEWNRLGQSDREPVNLTERFNGACETAFEPCRNYFAEQARQRIAATKVREELIAKIEKFNVNLNANNFDLKIADNFVQEIREAWRNSGLIDRRANDHFQDRFKTAMAPLQQMIRQAYQINFKNKENLVLRTESLLNNEIDLKSATQEVKRIQAEWRNLGYIPRHKDQALLQRLRTAADELFARLHAQLSAQENERKAAREARESLCEQLEILTQRIEYDLINPPTGEFATLEHQWASLPAAARDDANILDNRFRKAAAAYQYALANLGKRQLRASIKKLIARGALCVELENLIENNDGDILEKLTRLNARWNNLKVENEPDIGTDNESLIIKRFNQACAAANLPPMQRQLVYATNIEALEIICVRLEIVIGIESPPEAARLRLSYQVNQLAKGLGQTQETINIEQRLNQILQLLQNWYALGSIPQELRANFAVRLEKILLIINSNFL